MSNLDLTEEARIQRNKINYFISKVGNNDFDNAIEYLILADWDEKTAVQIYMSTHQNQNIHPNPNNNNINAPRQNNNNNNISNINRGNHQHHQQPPVPQMINQNILEFHINKSFFKSNFAYQSNDTAKYSEFLNYLSTKFPFIVQSLEKFLILLKDHAGIVILMDLTNFEQVKNDFRKVRSDSLCNDITRNAVLFPIMNNSTLGGDFVNQLSCISFPSYLFCKYKDQKDITINGRMEGSFHNSLLIDKLLNSLPDSQSNLRSTLRKSLRKSIIQNIISNNNNNNNVGNNNNYNRNNNNQNNNNDFFGEHNQDFFLGDSQEMTKLIEELSRNDYNSINNSQSNNNNLNNNNINNNENNSNLNNNYPNISINNSYNNQNIPINNSYNDPNIRDSIAGLSYGQILAKRENEMKELERQQEEKIKKEEEEKRKQMEEENKLKKIEENYQKEAEISKNLLPPEPDESNPDVCTIILRYPDGVKTMERRFLKTDKINTLFYFVNSKGMEVFSERAYNDFELIFGIPPKNLDNSKDKTLEEEGMFPNGIINIKEKS